MNSNHTPHHHVITTKKNSSSSQPPQQPQNKTNILHEVIQSAEIIFRSRLIWLILLGPIALFGKSAGLFGEFTSFILAGLALIPCAERLSFVTEQVAAHTNQTIGALLNATFGNAPELLISTAALRNGFYRVVQLTLLGSILTNLLLVFGVSCFVGGIRWHVQEVRLTSGNVSIGMLLVGVAGLLLPAALKMCGEERVFGGYDGDGDYAELMFSRFNALVMICMYFAYLFFQLETHKDEFDDEGVMEVFHVNAEENGDLLHPDLPAKRVLKRVKKEMYRNMSKDGSENEVMDIEMIWNGSHRNNSHSLDELEESSVGAHSLDSNDCELPSPQARLPGIDVNHRRRLSARQESDLKNQIHNKNKNKLPTPILRNRNTRGFIQEEDSEDEDVESEALIPQRRNITNKSHMSDDPNEDPNSPTIDDDEALLSFRTGIIWLLVITTCISSLSDILVDTIDGFAAKSELSEVFTSVIIIPVFSNIAEQVSALLFAYRNKMDLCLGITVGSAVQVSCCVLPGCVLIGWVMDRSMSLYFRGYETYCLVLGVLSVSAILHGGTTNWLVGAFFIGVYFMIAAGFWFHELEDLSVDEELIIHNMTSVAGT